MPEFLFNDQLSDFKSSDLPEIVQDVEKSLFGKKTINEIIDQFEREQGIRPPATKKTKIKYNNTLLNMADEEDKATLNDILNKPEQFRVIHWEKNWTVRGDFKIFIIYEEIEQKEKGTTNGTTQ